MHGSCVKTLTELRTNAKLSTGLRSGLQVGLA